MSQTRSGERRGRRWTKQDDRSLKARMDCSEALAVALNVGGARLSKRDSRKWLGGSHNPTLTDLAEMAHRLGVRIELVGVPLSVNEWMARRHLQAVTHLLWEIAGKNPYRQDEP